MASTNQCPYCGGTITSRDQKCPNCGAPNAGFVAEAAGRITHPRTIEELKQYCDEHGMPLLRMRFFVGEDYQQPKAFGIYRDGEDFIVYKNKADGTRAVRYRGPDEAHAVDELFQKLLSECHNRGIYPDGKPSEDGRAGTKKKRSPIPLFIAAVLAISLLGSVFSRYQHREDGYYRTKAGYTYYRYGSDWYTWSDSNSDLWYAVNAFPEENYGDYFQGTDYDSDWGGSDFKQSDTWEELHENSSDSDYDSWDSGDTDWDSDW